MIRFASVKDVNELKMMWHNIFGDEMSYIDLFFDRIFKADKTLVYEENGAVCAMLYMVEYTFVRASNKYHLEYLYALATKEEYRGKGIMNELINEATNVANKLDADALILIPVDEKMRYYYEKRGFEVVKHLQKQRGGSLITFDELRVKNGIALSDEQIDFLKELVKLENVDLYSFEGHYALCKEGVIEDEYTIMMKSLKNFTVQEDDIMSLLLV